VYYLHWVVPIQFGRAEKPAACIVGESTGMFVVRVDRGIWLEFPINPFGNKGLEL
jgi:hypothetical protein